VRFNHLESLHWLWALLVVVVVLIIAAHGRRRRLRLFASELVLARLVPAASSARRGARIGLVLVAMMLLVFCLLDPRWGLTFQEVQQRGIDVFVVLDVSRSMMAEDVRPNRLERARQQVLDLVEQLGGDRIGLVTFAGVPSLACPLTVDYGAFRLALDEAGPDLVPRGGSALGDALRLAGESFTDDLPENKAVIVFTDGEDHDSYPIEAARQLAEQRGAKIFTVGIGDETQGARIPVEEQGQRVFLTHEGQEVWSRMDRELLTAVALATDGAFIPVGIRTVDMGEVYRERIAPGSGREFKRRQIEQYRLRFQWFAGLALALLLAESLVGDRRAGARRAPTEAAS
jgi:Ca-activated chloride channel family protein